MNVSGIVTFINSPLGASVVDNSLRLFSLTGSELVNVLNFTVVLSTVLGFFLDVFDVAGLVEAASVTGTVVVVLVVVVVTSVLSSLHGILLHVSSSEGLFS